MPPKRKKDLPAARRTRCKTTEGDADVDSKQPSAFLSLPAELRNDIYERVLAQEKPIKINLRLREPRLLRVCRQVRADARKICYLQNSFEVKVRDCDAYLATAFLTQAARVCGGDKTDIAITYRITGRKVWRSLLRWCKQMHEHRFRGLKEDQGAYPAAAVMAAAHAIVHASMDGGGTWAQCLETLKTFRIAIGKLDKSWLR